ncbi:hypothetical protein HNR39_004455 [Glaciimonas immobilis]|uniref:DUF7868 domain-containing protein n=1 Tax=Glaciimonas immobilis TaxID=728004 RepID=A0A840RVD1_9BURK|nr:hypothetical protein [Glaciimonas immobilis]KAF3995894.1 hypothetical protein HAV38_21515 [Glaciimonas immobilis]MBB5202587.1 hypothetical protein [Glaciimonas immobilis]
MPNSEGTNGMQCYLDITPQVAHFKGAALSIDTQLQVSIRPRNKLPDGVEISIERMRIYVETIKNLPTKA